MSKNCKSNFIEDLGNYTNLDSRNLVRIAIKALFVLTPLK